MYDIFKLKRSDTLIKRKCKVIKSALVATTDISVIVPVSLEHGKLLEIGERTYTIASILYTDGKEYSIMNLCTIIELGPTDHNKIMVKGFDGKETECYEFKYTKGDTIHPTNEVPITPTIAYPFANHHIFMGKTIPYFDREDIDSILDSIPRFCKFGLPEYGFTNHITNMVLRDAHDLQVPLRLSKSKEFKVIPFTSVILNVSSVIGKNQGGWMEDGMQSSIMTTSKSSSTFEKVIRS